MNNWNIFIDELLEFTLAGCLALLPPSIPLLIGIIFPSRIELSMTVGLLIFFSAWILFYLFLLNLRDKLMNVVEL